MPERMGNAGLGRPEASAMISFPTVNEAIGRAKRFGLKLHSVPSPAGITADVLEGRFGWLLWGFRRLIYLRRGRYVSWYEWRAGTEVQLELPFASEDAETGES